MNATITRDGIHCERIYSGAWVLYSSDSHGYLVTRQYQGYTKKEALAMFRSELRSMR